ncbi:MAG: hypothetical protein ABL859_06025, partial [Methylotenera sp.]
VISDIINCLLNRGKSRVQRKGYSEVTKTFTTRSEASAWARVIESEMDRGVFINRAEAETTIFAELLTRYLNEI